MKKVAVIFGGKSSEYLVSLSSASSVLKHFPYDEYECLKIGMTEDGRFLYGDFSIEEIENNTWYMNKKAQVVMVKPGHDSAFFDVHSRELIHVDVAFNMIHGKVGEDGVLQSLFELGGIKYTGCDKESSIVSYDKELVHRLLNNDNIIKANYVSLNEVVSEEAYEEIVAKIGKKVIIKPAREGSSYGIAIANNYDEFNEALTAALSFDSKVIAEQFVVGFEIGTAVLEKDGELVVGLVDEIELATEFFDYEGKYAFKDARIVCPARIDDVSSERVQNLAKFIFKRLECRDFARIDFFYGHDGRIYFNEINTIPGFTSHSRFPNMMKGIGIEYSEIISTLIENAVMRS